jgi:hypothetical protein
MNTSTFRATIPASNSMDLAYEPQERPELPSNQYTHGPALPGIHSVPAQSSKTNDHVSTYELAPLTTAGDQCSSLIPPENIVSAVPLESKWKRYLPSLISLAVTAAWVSVTIWLSVVTGRLIPILSVTPKTTIFILNIFSAGSALLLGQVVGQIFEHLRWTLGSSRSGISLDTFLGLGSAIGNFGVLELIWNQSTLRHRLWCSQR